MKKLAVVFVSASVFFFTTPPITFAAINSLNGLTGATQTLATTSAATSTMHMRIFSSGSSHSFLWNGTPWLLNQGGTGTTSFATSSIPFINNGIFSENNLQFFWDTINNILNIGGTTTPAAKLSVRGSGNLDLLNIASSTGSSFFYISSAGNVGLGTTSPSEKLEVVGDGKFSGSLQANMLTVSATSTANGPVGIGNTDPKSALDVSGTMYSRLVTDTDAPSLTINWSTGNVHKLTLNTSTTNLTFTNGQAGGEYKIILNQDSTGWRTINWPSSVKWAGGTLPTLTSTSNAIDTVSFMNDGTNYLGTFTPDYKLPSSPLLNNLAGYWKFDESSGDAADATGNGLTLTNNNAAAYDAGLLNNGVSTVEATPSFMSRQTGMGVTGSYTISVWVKPTSTTTSSGTHYIIHRNGGGGNNDYWLYYQADATSFIGYGWGAGPDLTSNVTLTAGNWYHLVVTWDGSNVHLYVNGVDEGANAWATPAPSDGGAQTTVVGGNAPSGSTTNDWDGMIDELGIWTRALSSVEVGALYNNGNGLQYPF